MIQREKKRIHLEKKYASKRVNLLKEYYNEKNFSEKLNIHSKLQKLPRNSAKNRIQNWCGFSLVVHGSGKVEFGFISYVRVNFIA